LNNYRIVIPEFKSPKETLDGLNISEPLPGGGSRPDDE
jgi:hypothetical protein